MSTAQSLQQLALEYLDGDDDARGPLSDAAEEAGEFIWDFLASLLDDDDQTRIVALCSVLNCNPSDITEQSYDGVLYGHGKGYEAERAEYAVLTDTEADDAWEAALEFYLDECVLPEVPESMRHYFDTEAWIRDAKMDGRGQALNSYDGNEEEVKLAGEWFYIYRTN